MFDRRSISMFLSFILFLDLTSSFYMKEERYKKKISRFEEVETITDPAKVKLLMAQPAKEEFKFIPVLIPDKFSKYDSIDHDGHISLKELIRTTGAERNAKNAFQAADEDADGEISQEEFKKAPWSMKPTSVNSNDKEEYIDEVKFENVTDNEENEVDNGGRKDIEEETEEEKKKEEEEGDIEKGEKYEEGGEESFIEIVEGRGKDFVIEKVKKEKLERAEEVKRVEVKGDKERGGEERGEEVVIIEENGDEGEEKEEEVVLEEEEKQEEELVAIKVGGITEKEETEEKDKEVNVGMEESGHIETVNNEIVDTIEEIERGSKEEKGGGRERSGVNAGKNGIKKNESKYEGGKYEDEMGKEDLEKKHIPHSDLEILDPHKLVKSSGQVDFIEDNEESGEWLDLDETSGELPEEGDSDQERDSEDKEGKTTGEQNDERFED